MTANRIWSDGPLERSVIGCPASLLSGIREVLGSSKMIVVGCVESAVKTYLNRPGF